METITLERKKVYDPFLRIIHAWNGLAILLLIITGFFKKYLPKIIEHKVGFLVKLHVYIGIGLCVGLTLRIIWAMIGPSSARFLDLWHPRAWWKAVSQRKLDHYERFGHDVYSSFAYLAVYGLLLAQCTIGLILGPFRFDAFTHALPIEFLKEVHLAINYVLLLFVVVHVSMLIVHEKRQQAPLAQSMISGFQYKKK